METDKTIMNTYNLIAGDSLHVLPTLPDNHFDSIVTDPPYGISFMGKAWDHGVPSVAIWRECYRVLKPGGYLLSFAGTRTQHRMATNIEDAGFEIRDMIGWMYGSGFPKSLNISKAIDKAAGAKREDVGRGFNAAGIGESNGGSKLRSDHPCYVKPTGTTEAAKQWDGWGTALKPAFEPICMARKPLSESTVAANVLKWGTGGINIDGCRVGTEIVPSHHGTNGADGHTMGARNEYVKGSAGTMFNTNGRFPANLIHDGSDEVLAGFPETKSGGGDKSSTKPTGASYGNVYGDYKNEKRSGVKLQPSSGSAARFFYCAKASKQDRDAGLPEGERSDHPTVKPTDLMRYLCRLVTPPNGTILDPFNGSGSTGRGAVLEGFNYIGIELDAGHIAISEARINEALTTARNKAGDFTPTAKEKQSGQLNIFEMMPAEIKLRGLTADEYDETFGGDAMKR